MGKLTLTLLKECLGVARFSNNITIPDWAFSSEFLSITKTGDELSIVCSEELIPEGVNCERGWKALKVEGPLDFCLIGILAKISNVLAKAEISIFAVSTYDTDYILIKEEKVEKAIESLSEEGYIINI